MAKFENVTVELHTTGINKVLIGEHDITKSVRVVSVRAEADTLTLVDLELVPGTVGLSFDEASVVAVTDEDDA